MNNAIVFVMFFCVQAALSKVVLNHNMERDSRFWKNICVPVTGVTNQMIENVHQGKFEDAPEIKRYTTCLWRVSGVMNEAGVIDMRLVLYYFPNMTPVEIEAYTSCNQQVLQPDTDFVERVFQMEKCVYKLLNPLGKFVFF